MSRKWSFPLKCRLEVQSSRKFKYSSKVQLFWGAVLESVFFVTFHHCELWLAACVFNMKEIKDSQWSEQICNTVATLQTVTWCSPAVSLRTMFKFSPLISTGNTCTVYTHCPKSWTLYARHPPGPPSCGSSDITGNRAERFSVMLLNADCQRHRCQCFDLIFTLSSTWIHVAMTENVRFSCCCSILVCFLHRRV